MSDNGVEATLVEFYNTVFIANLCGNAATAILLYEYLATFSDEVNLFWRKEWTATSVFFFLNRYVPLLATTVNYVTSVVPPSV
ncbi:hypothetical protein C8Q76DRAFT_194342 [Earliella scabrosa]|nr:hypothetical protein C8Q76DRAFT_194342 [Earliella scabrosa]